MNTTDSPEETRKKQQHSTVSPQQRRRTGRATLCHVKAEFILIILIILFAILSVILSTLKLDSLANFDSAQNQYNKKNEHKLNPNDRSRTISFTVDILSVSSINQLALLHAQQSTIATHKSVRNFFNVTERDDADPNCHTDITFEHVESVSKFCRKQGKEKPIIRYLRNMYANANWLRKKKNPMGWLCAQVRPYSGLMKAQLHYQRSGQQLPNYLLIFDDDTYYNMEKFQMNFASLDSSIEKVYAGCLVRFPVRQINYTFPFGGFGSILSEGALVRLFRRHTCPGLGGFNDTYSKDHVSFNEMESSLAGDSSAAVCSRLKEDNIGELKYFTNGMSLVELMYKYSSTDKYRNVKNWARGSGFCMHSVRIMRRVSLHLMIHITISCNLICISLLSLFHNGTTKDWVLGYFVNYYNISTHVREPYYKHVPHARFESYKDSEIYRKPKGFCRNDAKCEKGTEICHRATPEWMESEVTRLKLMSPDKFIGPNRTSVVH